MVKRVFSFSAKKVSEHLQTFFEQRGSYTVMKSSQSKKAVQARKWRAKARDRRQLNNVVSNYVYYKYRSIYNEAHELFLNLKDKYPLLGPKCNLTKTPMFKRFVAALDLSDSEETTSTKMTSTPSSPEHDATETLAVNPESTMYNATETVVVNPESTKYKATETLSVNPAEYGATETVRSSTTEYNDTEMLTINPVEHSDTVMLPTNPVFAEHNNTESIQPEIIPVSHLHVGYNSNGEMYDELINEGEFVNMHNVNADILNILSIVKPYIFLF